MLLNNSIPTIFQTQHKQQFEYLHPRLTDKELYIDTLITWVSQGQ